MYPRLPPQKPPSNPEKRAHTHYLISRREIERKRMEKGTIMDSVFPSNENETDLNSKHVENKHADD